MNLERWPGGQITDVHIANKGHYAYVFLLVSSLRAGTGFIYLHMFTAHTMTSYIAGTQYILESTLTY